MTSEVSLIKDIAKLTFQSNLVFLQQRFPHLYEKFKDYQPKEYGIELDDKNNLNIACNGHFIYQGDPQKTTKMQVEKFKKVPVRSIYRMPPVEPEDMAKENPVGFEHLELLSNICRRGRYFEAEAKKENVHNNPMGRIPFLTVIGVGLGYHLEHLAKENIDSLYIYEPNEDLFYTSLFTLNWQWLVEQFTKTNKTITILVGKSKELFFDGFTKLFFRFGAFKSASIAFYVHFESESSEQIIDYVIKNGKVIYSGFGFIEDEIISLEHTYQNIKRDRKFLLNCFLSESLRKLPVFICGSGPSIDNDIEYIKQNQDNAIIVSCGSSLMALLNYGIQPDFHFEIERTQPVYDWLEAIEQKEKLKDIVFLGMNTIYPPVMDFFKDAILFMKPNDAGTDMVRVTFQEGKWPHVYGTNPTVVNGAVGFFNFVKSGDMYLFGCDMGFKDPEKHHSSQTGYFNEFKEQHGGSFNHSAVRPGNFGGEVLTDSIFDSARNSVEYSIRHHVHSDNHKVVYNCSDGAKIDGALPLPARDINVSTSLDKDMVISGLLCFATNEGMSVSKWESAITERINCMVDFIDNVIIDERLLEIDIEPMQVIDIFDTINQKLFAMNNSDNIVAIRTLRGSLSYVQTSITGYLFWIGNNEYCREFIKEALAGYFEYFKQMKRILIEKREVMGVLTYDE